MNNNNRTKLRTILHYLLHPIQTLRYRCDLCEHHICRCPSDLF